MKAILIPLLVLGASQAAAQANAARDLAAGCSSCHGTEGRSVTREVAPLAAMNRQALAAAMTAFREGRREGTVMPQIAKGYNDRQIELIADYFSRKAP